MNKFTCHIKENESDRKYSNEMPTFIEMNQAIAWIEKHFKCLGDPKWVMETLDGETWMTFTREYSTNDMLGFIEVH